MDKLLRKLAFVSVFLPGVCWGCAEGQRPNLVLIMADDLGYECVGANGGTSYRTPALNKLAEEGVRFEHCYAQPLCTPSRVQIMTGLYNVRNYVYFGKLGWDQTTFANVLREAGYATCVAGKWQLTGNFEGPDHFGFDEYCLWLLNRAPGRYPNPGLEINGKEVDYTGGEYGPDICTDYICDFITRKKDQPFLVYYPMILPHCPFEPTPDSEDWDPTSKGAETYEGNAKYFGDMVTYMDKLVGKIVGRLEELDLREDTLILFVADNGTDSHIVSRMGDREVPGGKGSITDNGTRVPLIASWPGTIGKDHVSDDLVDLTDFLPTLCDAAGVSPPPGLKLDGRSFLPRLRGEEGDPREWVFCWFFDKRRAEKAQIFARNHRFKLQQDGRFFDMSDGYAPRELGVETIGDEAAEAHELLLGVLKQYENVRAPTKAGGRRPKEPRPGGAESGE